MAGGNLLITWHDEESCGDIDYIPLHWFQRDGAQLGLEHKITSGRASILAKCDLTVASRTAELDYAPHKKFNRQNDVYLGVMRIEFSDLQRSEVRRVGWRLNTRHFDYSLATARISKRVPRPGQPGPRPSEWSSLVRHTKGPTSTYALRFGGTTIWKIGISKNPVDRCASLNYSVPSECLDGAKWEIVGEWLWPCGEDAWEMEQSLLKLMKSETSERVETTPGKLRKVLERYKKHNVWQKI